MHSSLRMFTASGSWTCRAPGAGEDCGAARGPRRPVSEAHFGLISTSGAQPSGSQPGRPLRTTTQGAWRQRQVCSSPAHATYPSGRISTAGGAATSPRTGSSHAIVLGVDQPDSIRPRRRRRSGPGRVRKRATPAVDVKKLARTPRPHVEQQLALLSSSKQDGTADANCRLRATSRRWFDRPTDRFRAQPGT